MTPVGILNNEYKSIIEFLNTSGQPTLSTDVDKYFKKVITLSSASYFEHRIQEILINFISMETNWNNKAVSFFKKKAVDMQYHTYFNWGEKNAPDKPGNNANAFFAMFGDDFKKSAESEIKKSAKLEASVKAFLALGHLRNILVHSNFAAYEFENKTTEDIFKMYESSLIFITFLEKKLHHINWSHRAMPTYEFRDQVIYHEFKKPV